MSLHQKKECKDYEKEQDKIKKLLKQEPYFKMYAENEKELERCKGVAFNLDLLYSIRRCGNVDHYNNDAHLITVYKNKI